MEERDKVELRLVYGLLEHVAGNNTRVIFEADATTKEKDSNSYARAYGQCAGHMNEVHDRLARVLRLIDEVLDDA